MAAGAPDRIPRATAPIERSFPSVEVSEIAGAEGHARRSRRPVYNVHKWWARRPGAEFRAILLHALWDRAGDPWDAFGQDPEPPLDRLVVDPFMGGGTTIVEALRLGCRVVGQDLSPVAWFVTRKTVEPVDPAPIEEAFADVRRRIDPIVRPFYRARCGRCGEDASLLHAFWVKRLPCPACGHAQDLFKNLAVVEEHGRPPRPHLILCPSCGGLVPAHGEDEPVQCPCGRAFHPKDDAPVRNGEARCAACGHAFRLIPTIARHGRPAERLFLIEVHCRGCGRSYRTAEAGDVQAFEAARARLASDGRDLPIPSQEIPRGTKTQEILNHGYVRWRDLFNPRQLLALGLTLRAIREVPDTALREMLLLAFSDCLHYNNALVPYNRPRNHIELLFRHHAFHPKTTYAEGHVLGLGLGRGSLATCVRKIVDAKRFAAAPQETILAPAASHGGTRRLALRGTSRPIAAHAVAEAGDLRAPGDALLLCGSSVRLPLPDGIADAVITDPPYYDNVMYAELSNFFYVWLREGLGAAPPFESPDAPNGDEIVRDPGRGKDDASYVDGLVAAFREAARVLRPGGIICFTYHHQEARAWSTLIEALLEAGLRPTAVHPIRTEMGGSPHIHERDGVRHDLVLACRRSADVPPTPAAWDALARAAVERARAALDALERLGPVGPADARALLLGIGLVLWGLHHPLVTDARRRRVSLAWAAEDLLGRAAEVAGRFTSPNA